MASPAKKIDYKRELKEIYSATRRPAIIEVPPLDYALIEGTGGPYGEDYRDAVAALFTISYKAKFMVRERTGVDFGVMPLESLWHTDSGEEPVGNAGKGSWKWTAMIMQPEPVGEDVFREARDAVLEKKERPAADLAVHRRLSEGRAAQVLHVGP
jgi:hypothetical protein